MVAPRHRNALTGDITLASGNDALRLGGIPAWHPYHEAEELWEASFVAP
jgi:hypothetical protein